MVYNPGKAVTQISVAGLFEPTYCRITTVKETEHTFYLREIRALNPDIS
jgi:hypothetical protein